jgi:uncharacterized Zn finger protein (UPF0148 family)
MSSGLLDCPFCGHFVTSVESADGHMAFVFCPNCDTEGPPAYSKRVTTPGSNARQNLCLRAQDLWNKRVNKNENA